VELVFVAGASGDVVTTGHGGDPSREKKMWNDRFLFVYSALLVIGLWIVIGLRRKDVHEGQRTYRGVILGVSIVALAGILLVAHLWYYRGEPTWPGLGSILAALIGGVVGSFTAHFVWSLFDADFGRKDPLIGVSVLIILIIVYSLPTYQREMSALLGHLGIASVKTPVVELSFTQQSQFRNAVASASSATGDEHSSAIPRPSDPKPGLDELVNAVSDGNFAKEDRYIAYFDGRSIPDPGAALTDATLIATQQFLRPAKALAVCLKGYVDIFPDSQLLLVDIKPLLQWFFRTHAHAVKALYENRAESDDSWQDAKDFRKAVVEVRNNVLRAIDLPVPAEGAPRVTDRDLRKKQVKLGYAQAPVGNFTDDDLRKKLAKLGYPPAQIDEFVNSCGESLDKASKESTDNPGGTISYLQPYVTIALAKLLIAHGSSDGAIHVLTKWLDLWRCARGNGPGDNSSTLAKCPFRTLPTAAKLPDWFSIRAEFELNVLLYKNAGDNNIVYRDFLKAHAEHFKDLALRSPINHGGNLSIRAELTRCLSSEGLVSSKSSEPVASVQRIRAVLLRALLQNEDTLLRSEIHFLSDLKWADMENLLERALALTRFRIECINPENGLDRPFWDATLANYSITAGLLAFATSDRLAVTAASSEERAHADEIRNNARAHLRYGYRSLKQHLDKDREKFKSDPWSERVFGVSGWEQSCSLAERALYQLNASSRQ
jgi:hypothetical protein